MAVLVTVYQPQLSRQVPRLAESLGRRLLTTRASPPRCPNCRQNWVYNTPAKYSGKLLSPPYHGRFNAVTRSHRAASSVPPRLDPDVERLQRSMKGMVGDRPVQYDGDRLIYEVRAGNYVKVVMLAFYGTAIGGLYMGPDLVVGAWESDTMSMDIVLNLMMLASGVIILPTLMTLLARRLVLKMYHNEARNTYLAVVSKNVLGLAKNRFNSNDVAGLPENSFQRMFRLTAFRVKGRPYFVNSSHFKSPSDYNKLMHYT